MSATIAYKDLASAAARVERRVAILERALRSRDELIREIVRRIVRCETHLWSAASAPDDITATRLAHRVEVEREDTPLECIIAEGARALEIIEHVGVLYAPATADVDVRIRSVIDLLDRIAPDARLTSLGYSIPKFADKPFLELIRGTIQSNDSTRAPET